MANTILTVQEIAREVLPLLRENLVMPQTVNTNYSAEFVGKGDTIIVEKPAVFVADEFGSTINLQDIKERSVAVKMDKIADVSFTISAKDFALKMPQFKTKYLESAATAIAEKVNQDGLSLYKDIPYFYGVSGTTPDAIKDFTQARKVLNNNKCPMSNRVGIWDPEADAAFLELDAIINADKSGSTQALRDGAIGDVVGFQNYMSQAVKTHTAGGYAALADVTITTGAADATSIVLTSAAGASTAKLLEGDIFTLDGNQYVVTADTAAAASGVVTVAIYPALPVAFGDMTSVAVTFPDVTAGGHTANLVYNKDAFIFVTRPLELPMDKEAYVVTDSASGLSMRVVVGYDQSTKATTLSLDMLYDYVTSYEELACRVLG